MNQPVTAHPTLARVALPRPGLAAQVLLVLGGSLLTAAAAQVSVPLYGQGLTHPLARLLGSLYGALGLPLPATPVPLTGQTFTVLLVGAVLGSRLGAASLLLYLGQGLLGLPVFALGTSAWSPSRIPGLPVILGPTAGYLLAFPVAAWVVGRLAERGWDRRPWSTALAMLLGNLVIYVGGLAWLARFTGPGAALSLGMVPFLPGDLLKLLAAAALLPSAWVVLRRSKLL